MRAALVTRSPRLPIPAVTISVLRPSPPVSVFFPSLSRHCSGRPSGGRALGGAVWRPIRRRRSRSGEGRLVGSPHACVVPWIHAAVVSGTRRRAWRRQGGGCPGRYDGRTQTRHCRASSSRRGGPCFRGLIDRVRVQATPARSRRWMCSSHARVSSKVATRDEPAGSFVPSHDRRRERVVPHDAVAGWFQPTGTLYRQREAHTISSQTAALVEWATTPALELPRDWIFEDDGYAGATFERPGLERSRTVSSCPVQRHRRGSDCQMLRAIYTRQL